MSRGAGAAPLSGALVDELLRQRAAGLPAEVLAQARLHLADALGIAVAARATVYARQVVQAQAALAGPGRCALVGGGQGAPLAAAFVNSALIHILDYDDIHDVGRLHPGTVVLPAALAGAELAGAADADLVEAAALATELVCRLGVVCAPQGEGPGSEWFLTQLFGYVAAAVAAGIALGLGRDALVSAIGLAYMQAAGGKQSGFGTGSTARSIYPAFAAQAGVQAALLARAGMSGPEGALDGAAGLFRIYLGSDPAPGQVSALLDFSHWHSLDVQIKPWPCCRLSHPYVAAAMEVRKSLAADAVAQVRASVNASAARLCRPLAQRRRPQTLQDAKYSIPFMTAYALVHGAPVLGGLNEEAVGDARVLELAARIEVHEDLPDGPGHPPAVLVLRRADGTTHRSEFRAADLAVGEQALRRKFDDCFEFGGCGHAAADAWAAVMSGRLRQALALARVPSA
jgi:2-methylcitrate dehydratase PrpD